MNETATADNGRYMGVRAYAAARALNPSTVSKQVKKGIIPTYGRDADGSYLIDPEEADRARALRLNPLKARGRGPGLGYEPSLAQAEAALAGERRSPDDAAPRHESQPLGPLDDGANGKLATGKLATAHFAEKAVKAQLAQLDLEDRLKIICDRAGVEKAGFALGALVRDALIARQRELADRFAAMTDPGEILVLMRAKDNELLRALAEKARALEELHHEAA